MLLKSTSAGDNATNIAKGLLQSKENGINLTDFIDSFDEINSKDLGKAFGLSGFTEDVLEAALRTSKFEKSLDDVKTEFNDFNKSTSGIKGKLNTIKEGFSRIGSVISTKISSSVSTLGDFWGALNPATKVLGVAGVVGGIGLAVYKHVKEAQFQAASGAISEWTERDASLTDQIDQYTKLQQQIEAGNLSSQQEYDIKSQILDIQNQISDAYEDQASGIDLVNGSLDEQLDKLNEIRAADAKNTIEDHSNSKGFKTAEKKMTKKNHTYLGEYYDNGSDESNALNTLFDRMSKKYGNDVFSIDKDGITTQVHFEADAETAEKALNEFMTGITDIEDKYGESDVLSMFSDNALGNSKSGLTEANNILDKYQETYDQYKNAKLYSDEKDYGGHTAAEWISNYAKAVNDYNQALSTGDQAAIDTAKEHYNAMQKSISTLVNGNEDFAEYKFAVEDVEKELDTASAKKNDFSNALRNSKDTNGYEKRLNSLANTLKGLNLNESEFFDILRSGNDSDAKNTIQSLISMAKSAGYITGTSSSEIQPLIDLLGELGYMSVDAASHIDTTALSAEQLATKVETAQTALSNINSVISASNSDSGLLADNITALEESFGGLDSYNAESLLSNTADGVKLNTTALKGLIEQQHKVDSDDLEARIKGQNEELQKQKDILNDVTQSEDNKQNAKEQIDSITDAIERMKQAQSQLYASYKQQMELTSDYQAVLDAESTPNAGARYDNMKSKVKTAKEAFDKGEIGTDDFKTVARYLSPNGFEDPDNFIENYQKAKRYLTDDSSGVINFLQDLQSKGLATMTTLADGTHEWTTSFDDAAEASRQAGMGYEFFMDMFGKAEDYGAFNTFISSAEEGELKVQDLSKQLADAKVYMAELQAQGADTSSIEGQQKVIDELEAKLGKQQDVVDDFYSSYDQRQAKQLETKKQELDIISDMIKNTSDQQTKDNLIASFKQLAKEYGLDYNFDQNSGNISVDNDSYKDQMSKYGNTWVNPASAEDMGYKEGTQEAKDYQAAVDSLTAAHEKNDAATEEAFQTLSQYNAEELKGIELDNKKYDSDDEGLRKAEDALQMLADTYGLTKDQILEGLEGAGQLKPEIDTESIEKAKQEAQETKDSLHELQDSGYIDKNVDLDEDLTNKTKDQLQSEKDSLEDTVAKLKVDPEVDQSKIDDVQSEIENRDIQLKIREALEPSDGSQGYTIEQLQEMTDEEIVQKVGIDADESSLQSFHDQLDKLEAQAAEIPVNIRIADDQLNAIVEALGGKPLEKDVDINATGDVDKVNSIIDAPPVKQLGFEVSTSDVSGSQALMDMFGEDNVKKSIDIQTNGDIEQINNIFSQLNGTPVEVLVSWAEQGMSLDDIIAKANGEEVEVPVEYEDPDAIDTSSLDPVDLKARISSVETDEAAPPVMDATANITSTQGADGQQVNVDATANITDTQGADGQQVNIDATANITDTTGAESQSINVDANTSGTEDVDKLKSSVDSVESKEVKAEAKVNGEPQVRSLKSAIDSLYDKTVTVTAVTNGANTVTALGSAINALHDKTVTITTNHVNNGSSGGATKATGTMTSIAHADGTAYNMLNLKPLSSAHAGGNVALNQNETALTNEVGTESIVRDGVWSLLPISFSSFFASVWFFSFPILLEILSQNKLHPYVLPKSLVLDKF